MAVVQAAVCLFKDLYSAKLMSRKKVLAISGSTRSGSVNTLILQALADMYRTQLEMDFFSIDRLPHFNPDLDKEPLPAGVTAFRNMIDGSDGILICTPEYVFSLPGSFKNAIEWTISTTLFTGKPAALITASSSGLKAKEALENLMGVAGVVLPDPGSLLIQAPKNKISDDGRITDPVTGAELKKLMDAFIQLLTDTSRS